MPKNKIIIIITIIIIMQKYIMTNVAPYICTQENVSLDSTCALLKRLASWVKFSAGDILKYSSSVLSRKQVLTFRAIYLQWRQFECNVNCYLGKIRKILIYRLLN